MIHAWRLGVVLAAVAVSGFTAPAMSGVSLKSLSQLKTALTLTQAATDTVASVIKATADHFKISPESLSPDTTFASLGDELDLVTVLTELENQYDIDLVFQGKYEGHVDTLGDAATFINQLIAAKPQ